MSNEIPIPPELECKFHNETESVLYCELGDKIANTTINFCKTCELGNLWRNIKCKYISGRIKGSSIGPYGNYWIIHEKICSLKGKEISKNKCSSCDEKILEK